MPLCLSDVRRCSVIGIVRADGPDLLNLIMPQGTIKTVKTQSCKNMKSYCFQSPSKLNLEELYIAISSTGAYGMQPWGLRSHLSCEKAGTLNPEMQCFSLCRPGDHLQVNCCLGSVMVHPHKSNKKLAERSNRFASSKK